MTPRKISWFLAPAIPALLVLAGSPAQGQLAPKTNQREALIRISSTVPRILKPGGALGADAGHSTFMATEMVIMKSLRTMKRALGDPSIKPLNLTLESLRAAVSTEALPGSEIVAIVARHDQPNVAKIIANAVADAYLSAAIEEDRNNRLERLDKLRKLYDGYQVDIKHKKASLAALRESAGAGPTAFEIELNQKRLTADVLERDRIELQRVGIAARLELLKHEKNPTKEMTETIGRFGVEIAGLDAQLALLGKRSEVLAVRRPVAIDLSPETRELEVVLQAAGKLAAEIESIEVELQANPRASLISRAE